MKRRVLVSLLTAVLFWAAPATAQQITPVVTSEIEADFPDTLTFRLMVDENASVERVTLQYGTNARSCQNGGSRQSVEATDEEPHSFSWEWELKRSGALPPGSVVWWQWEIEESDGRITTTDRQEFVVADDQHRWQTLSQDGISVSWYQGDESFGQAMLAEAITSVTHLQTNLGLPRPEEMQLWFYPSAEAVQEVLINSPEWTGGVAYPEYGITVLGVATGQEWWAAQIVPHELTHLLEGMLTFNCRGIWLPTWLTEGLARFAEDSLNNSERVQVEAALADADLPPLTSLAAGFSAYSDGANLAYTQSGMVVAYLVETYGPEQMTSLLETMQSGLKVDEALTAVYGFDTAGLDAEWRTSLGYIPTPTSAADAAAAQATPSAVPTRALGGIPQAATATGTAVTETPTPPPATYTPEPATPTHTVTPAATTVAAAATEPPSTIEPAPQPEPETETVSTVPWLPLAGGVAFLAGIALIVYFVRRRG